MEKVEDYAKENETPLRIVALLLKKCRDKNAYDFEYQISAQRILKSTPPKSKILPIDAAVAIMVNQLGHDTYTKLGNSYATRTCHISTLDPHPKRNIMFGFDGSSSHAIYRQLENEKTTNIILSIFCPLPVISSGDLRLAYSRGHQPVTPRTELALATT